MHKSLVASRTVLTSSEVAAGQDKLFCKKQLSKSLLLQIASCCEHEM